MMQSGQDRNCDNGVRSLDYSIQGRIFLFPNRSREVLTEPNRAGFSHYEISLRQPELRLRMLSPSSLRWSSRRAGPVAPADTDCPDLNFARFLASGSGSADCLLKQTRGGGFMFARGARVACRKPPRVSQSGRKNHRDRASQIRPGSRNLCTGRRPSAKVDANANSENRTRAQTANARMRISLTLASSRKDHLS
jgi:hypothetical protein